MWIEKEISIAEIDTLLNNGYEVEVDSPDGYVPVNLFINKGIYEEFILEIENFESVRCNGDHLFETKSGWKKASVLYENSLDTNIISVLTKLGYKSARVVKTGNKIPIVE